jgi:hypothetical protein
MAAEEALENLERRAGQTPGRKTTAREEQARKAGDATRRFWEEQDRKERAARGATSRSRDEERTGWGGAGQKALAEQERLNRMAAEEALENLERRAGQTPGRKTSVGSFTDALARELSSRGFRVTRSVSISSHHCGLVGTDTTKALKVVVSLSANIAADLVALQRFSSDTYAYARNLTNTGKVETFAVAVFSSAPGRSLQTTASSWKPAWMHWSGWETAVVINLPGKSIFMPTTGSPATESVRSALTAALNSGSR